MSLNSNSLSRFFFSLIFIVNVACIKEKNNPKDQKIVDQNTISFKLDFLAPDKGNKTYINEMVYPTNFIYINSGNNPKGNIGKADKVLCTSDRFFILDTRQQSLKIYDKTGHYLKDIGALGHGPGEYTDVYDFLINDGHILLLAQQRYILKYDLQGNFIDRYHLSFTSMEMGFLKSTNEYLFYRDFFSSEPDKNHISATNRSFKIQNSYFEYEDDIFQMDFSFTGTLVNGENGILVNKPFSDTIYEITANKITPKYVFDFDKNKLPRKLLKNRQKFFDDGLNYVHLGEDILEYKNYLFFNYKAERKLSIAIYNQQKETLFRYRDFKENALSNLFKVPVAVNENKLYSLILPFTIDWLIENNDDFEEQLKMELPDLYKLFLEVDYSGNPILMEFELKDETNQVE